MLQSDDRKVRYTIGFVPESPAEEAEIGPDLDRPEA